MTANLHSKARQCLSITLHAACVLTMAVLSQPARGAESIFHEIHGFEPRFLPPPHAAVANIKTDFGAEGDGITDDTEAFKAAIESDQPRTIYIPAGTYLIGDQLRYGEAASKKKRTLLIGESRESTVLRLKNSSTGFHDPANPKVFIHTRKSSQQGEQNMHMYIYHLTIEIEAGNPGAIALNFHTNNTGAIKDVAVRSTNPSGERPLCGIAFDDYWFGPGNGRYLEIDGFKTGIVIGSAQNHTTLEHIRIRNCDTGIFLKSNTASIRDCRISHCNLPVNNGGQMVLLGSILEGTGDMAINNKGILLCRNVTTSGFVKAIESTSPTGSVTSASVDEYLSHDPATNWQPDAGMNGTLRLPVEESSEYPYPPDSSGWTLIEPSEDIGPAINDAIAAGAENVLLVGGKIRTTIHLRNRVKRVMGYGVRPITCWTGQDPAFRLEEGNAPAVILELIYKGYGSSSAPMLAQASTRTIVFRHGSGGYRAEQAATGAKVFIESVVGHPFHFTGVHAWVRDINTEKGGPHHTNIVNDNATVWILGHKTEDWATKIATRNGGFTELLGGKYRQNWNQEDFDRSGIDTASPPPLFIVDNAHASLSFSAGGFRELAREIRGEETRSVLHKKYGGPHGGSQVLFTGYRQKTGNVSLLSKPSARMQMPGRAAGINTPYPLLILKGKPGTVAAGDGVKIYDLSGRAVRASVRRPSITGIYILTKKTGQ